MQETLETHVTFGAWVTMHTFLEHSSYRESQATRSYPVTADAARSDEPSTMVACENVRRDAAHKEAT
jgi:hypothetical protein